jgi:uncharacterized membrane protein
LAYGFAATWILTIVLAFELPCQALGVALLLFSTILLQVALRLRLWDFRANSYLTGLGGLAMTIWFNGMLALEAIPAAEISAYWLWLAPAFALFTLIACQVLRWDFGLPRMERIAIQHGSLSGGIATLALFIWYLLPAPVVALCWVAVALCLYEAGLRLQLPILRGYGCVLATLSFGRLFLADFASPGTSLGISHRILTVVPMIITFYFMSAQARHALQPSNSRKWERLWSTVTPIMATILAIVLIRFELGRVLAVAGWTIYMLGLYLVGLWLGKPELRWQSYLIAVLIFARSWSTNFYVPDSLAGVFGRVAAGIFVTAGFFAAQCLAQFGGQRRSDVTVTTQGKFNSLDIHARSLFAILGGLLAAILIFYEVSGRLLTVAWGLEGAALLVLGLLFQDRVMRYFSLSLLAVCIAKAFLYDLASLSTPYRIGSFVLLGVLLVLVSWFYTLYRKPFAQHGHI